MTDLDRVRATMTEEALADTGLSDNEARQVLARLHDSGWSLVQGTVYTEAEATLYTEAARQGAYAKGWADAKAVRGDGLLEALEFVADWAHDCSPSNRAAPWERQHGDEIDPRSYGFDDIEERCRAALRGDTMTDLDRVVGARHGPRRCRFAGDNRGWCVAHDEHWRIESRVCDGLLRCADSEYPHDTLADKASCPSCEVNP